MDIKYICNECKAIIYDKTKFCPHCGKPLVMVETTYTVNVEIKFREKPNSCSVCRFGTGGYDSGRCLLNLDIKFSNYYEDNYYGYYGATMSNCPIDKN